MIVIDTHIWLWWSTQPDQLTDTQRRMIDAPDNNRIGVCGISCWEIARLEADHRILLDVPALVWMNDALHFPGVELLPLTPEIAVESNNLPGVFHRDPADRIIVATARVHECPLITSDGKMLQYEHVATVS